MYHNKEHHLSELGYAESSLSSVHSPSPVLPIHAFYMHCLCLLFRGMIVHSRAFSKRELSVLFRDVMADDEILRAVSFDMSRCEGGENERQDGGAKATPDDNH